MRTRNEQMTRLDHRHKRDPKRDQEFAWTYCVRPGHCDGAAHGNIIRIEYCFCDAARRVEINGSHVVRGTWDADSDE